MVKSSFVVVSASLVMALASVAPAHATADVRAADEAKALFKKNDCTKCHATDKTKKGPSLKDIAAKYRAEGREKVIKNITTGPKVKLEDGTEEDHKIIETKDPKELKNLADWIMSR